MSIQTKPPTPKPPTDSELAKHLVKSLLRDLFAAATVASGCAPREEPYDSTAQKAFAQADAMLCHSHTPGIIKKMQNL